MEYFSHSSVRTSTVSPISRNNRNGAQAATKGGYAPQIAHRERKIIRDKIGKAQAPCRSPPAGTSPPTAPAQKPRPRPATASALPTAAPKSCATNCPPARSVRRPAPFISSTALDSGTKPNASPSTFFCSKRLGSMPRPTISYSTRFCAAARHIENADLFQFPRAIDISARYRRGSPASGCRWRVDRRGHPAMSSPRPLPITVRACTKSRPSRTQTL